jgi:hypothetical protein
MPRRVLPLVNARLQLGACSLAFIGCEARSLSAQLPETEASAAGAPASAALGGSDNSIKV